MTSSRTTQQKSKSSSTCKLCGKRKENAISLARLFRPTTTCRCKNQSDTPGLFPLTNAREDHDDLQVSLNDRYRVLALIGTGGMGAVYKASDSLLGRTVAVKVLSESVARDRDCVKRFAREAKALSHLNHPNIVSVYDHGTTDSGIPFLAMEFIDGHTLADAIRDEGRLNVPASLTIFIDICKAIAYAHNRGTIHRDLKPTNIILIDEAASNGNGNGNGRSHEETHELSAHPVPADLTSPNGAGACRLKIVDFGIAKLLPTADFQTRSLTQTTGELFGSPPYMSPEHCLGRSIDTRSDCYSLGCLMYETLTGKNPFNDENAFKIMLNQMQLKPPLMNEQYPELGLPPGLDKVVQRCLAKKPEDRYQNIDDLREDLELLQSNEQPRERTSRHKQLTRPQITAFAAVGVAVLIGLVAWSYVPHTSGGSFGRTAKNVVEGTSASDAVQNAIAKLSLAIAKDSKNARLYFERGMAYTARGFFKDAISDLSRALNNDPSLREAHQARARLLSLQSQYESAFDDCKYLLKSMPNNPDGYESEGYVWLQAEDYQRAVKDFKKAEDLVQKSPGAKLSTRAQLFSVEALVKLGRYLEAHRLIASLEAARSSQDSQRIIETSAMLECAEQNFSGARAKLLVPSSEQNVHSIAQAYLAYCQFGLKQNTEAEDTLGELFKHDVSSPRVQRLLAAVHSAVGLDQKCINDLRSPRSLENYSKGYRTRAVCLLNQGATSAAINDLRSAIELNPYSPITRSFVAVAEEQNGDHKTASIHMKDLLSQKDLPPIVYANAGKLQLHEGNYKEALAYCTTAIAADPYLKEAFEARAEIYTRLGDKELAEKDRVKSDSLLRHLDF